MPRLADKPVRIPTLQLDPPTLGAVIVKMRLIGGAVEVRLSADRYETTQMLQQERGALKDVMQSAGYAFDIASIDHSRASDANPGAGQCRHSRNKGNRSSCTVDHRSITRLQNGSPVMRRLARDNTGGNMTNSRNRRSDIRSRRLCAIGLAALSICSVTTARARTGPGEREMTLAARRHGVPLGVLYAVGLSETGRKGVLNPYALNIDGKTVLATDFVTP